MLFLCLLSQSHTHTTQWYPYHPSIPPPLHMFTTKKQTKKHKNTCIHIIITMMNDIDLKIKYIKMPKKWNYDFRSNLNKKQPYVRSREPIDRYNIHTVLVLLVLQLTTVQTALTLFSGIGSCSQHLTVVLIPLIDNFSTGCFTLICILIINQI